VGCSSLFCESFYLFPSASSLRLTLSLHPPPSTLYPLPSTPQNIDFDWVALSFVQQADDILQLRDMMGDHKGKVLAKIEKPSAIDNLKEITDVCDGIMVARGDLGVEMQPEDVPMLQK